MPYEQVIFELEEDIAVIRMNRPEKKNAFSPTMSREILEIMTISRIPLGYGRPFDRCGREFFGGARSRYIVSPDHGKKRFLQFL